MMQGTIAGQGSSTKLAFRAERDASDDGDAQDETEGDGDDGGDTDTEEQLGDRVDEDDADAKESPRYGGVSTYVWSPTANELIFVAGGDLYRLVVEDGSIDRLTRTREGERQVRFLPDGTGYTYLRGGALLRVSFGSHLIEQLDPRLAGGETMSGYAISPNGRRLVFLATKGASFWSAGRDVSIVNYRDRFARVTQVKRHMPDDPMPDYEWSIYLYELTDCLAEEATLKKVYAHKQSGPRDAVPVPSWAPDSSRVAFAVFEQSSGHVEILEAGLASAEEAEESEDDDAATAEAAVEPPPSDGDEADEDDEAARGRDRGCACRVPVPASRRSEHAAYDPAGLPLRQSASRLHHGAERVPSPARARPRLRAARPAHDGTVRGVSDRHLA